MAYNNKNYQGGYNQQGYGQQRQGGYQQQQPRYQQAPPPAPKRSAAKYTVMVKGKNAGLECVNGFKAGKQGMLIFSAFPVDGREHTSQTGNVFLRYVVTVVHKGTGTTSTYWCLMSKRTRKISIKELSLVISPNGNGHTASGKAVTGTICRNTKK